MLFSKDSVRDPFQHSIFFVRHSSSSLLIESEREIDRNTNVEEKINSMSKVIKRYEDLQPHSAHRVLSQEREFWKNQAHHLRKQVGYLNDVDNCLMGGNTTGLSFQELQNIEVRLESAMNRIRSRRNELLTMQARDIISKGNDLWAENNMLKRKLEELLQTSSENPAVSITDRLSTSEIGNATSSSKDAPDTKLKLG